MWGRPIESASPASRTASSRWRSKPSPRSFSTISPARVTRSCWARSQAPAIAAEVDPVAADVEVFRVLVHAGHLDRGHQLDPEPLGRLGRLGDAGDRVVVGEGEGRDPGLGGALDDLGRRAAGRRRRSSGSGARSTFAGSLVFAGAAKHATVREAACFWSGNGKGSQGGDPPWRRLTGKESDAMPRARGCCSPVLGCCWRRRPPPGRAGLAGPAGPLGAGQRRVQRQRRRWTRPATGSSSGSANTNPVPPTTSRSRPTPRAGASRAPTDLSLNSTDPRSRWRLPARPWSPGAASPKANTGSKSPPGIRAAPSRRRKRSPKPPATVAGRDQGRDQRSRGGGRRLEPARPELGDLPDPVLHPRLGPPPGRRLLDPETGDAAGTQTRGCASRGDPDRKNGALRSRNQGMVGKRRLTSSEADVAIDEAGEAAAVWSYFDGPTILVQASTKPAAGSFSAPATVSPGGVKSDEPQIGFDAEGEAFAAWRRRPGHRMVHRSRDQAPGGVVLAARRRSRPPAGSPRSRSSR